MPYAIQDVAPDAHVIVPEGREPLPVIYHDRGQAQQLADRLRWTQRMPQATALTTPAFATTPYAAGHTRPVETSR